MKSHLVILSAVAMSSFVFGSTAMAQHPGSSDKAKAHGMKSMPMEGSTQGGSHKGAGTVKRLDASRGAVTLDHEPIPSLKWPSMTMEFQVSDRKMLEHLKPGTKVVFQFTEQPKGTYLITELKH